MSQNTPPLERTICTIPWTMIKSYDAPQRYIVTNIPFSIKLTSLAFYSYAFWLFPIGRTLIKEIVSYTIIKNSWVGSSLIFKGIVIHSIESGLSKKIVFTVNQSELETVVSHLKILGIKEEKDEKISKRIN